MGWSEERVAATAFEDDGLAIIARPDVEVMMEITGSPAAGCAHALAAAGHRRPIVMVNVEADVLAGPVLDKAHARAGTVYSMAHDDQPTLVAELVGWARLSGLTVAAAGNGTRYRPFYHDVPGVVVRARVAPSARGEELPVGGRGLVRFPDRGRGVSMLGVDDGRDRGSVGLGPDALVDRTAEFVDAQPDVILPRMGGRFEMGLRAWKEPGMAGQRRRRELPEARTVRGGGAGARRAG